MKYLRIIDLETTGTDPTKHDIIEIGYVAVDVEKNEIVPNSSARRLVTPERWENRESHAMEINGISEESLCNYSLDLQATLDTLGSLDWEDTELAGWGVTFEYNFLTEAYNRKDIKVPFSYRTVDVRSIFDYYCALFQMPRPKVGLGGCCEYLEIEWDPKQAHKALYDATKTAEILRKMLNHNPPE